MYFNTNILLLNQIKFDIASNNERKKKKYHFFNFSKSIWQISLHFPLPLLYSLTFNSFIWFNYIPTVQKKTAKLIFYNYSIIIYYRCIRTFVFSESTAGNYIEFKRRDSV